MIRLWRWLSSVMLLILLLSGQVKAQIPPGYYDSADNLWGDSLRTALHQIIDDHTVLSYASLWTHFRATDSKPDSTVWDMYADQPSGTPAYSYSFGVDQCGNYAQEGDCYNREHSFPKSWFGDAPPMNTDLFHLYPVDGYVNGKRGNYPYGEVGVSSWVSSNGSRLGNASLPGYGSVVFEPIDEYKGDLARTYFYMLIRYMPHIASWSSPMLQDDTLALWAKKMLLQWALTDTVSTKEMDRNNAVFLLQGNRNPFIDHPEFVDYIWGNEKPNVSANRYIVNKPRCWSANNRVHWSGVSSYGKLLIYDVTGKLLYTSEVADEIGSVDLSGFSGVVFVHFETKGYKKISKVML